MNSTSPEHAPCCGSAASPCLSSFQCAAVEGSYTQGDLLFDNPTSLPQSDGPGLQQPTIFSARGALAESRSAGASRHSWQCVDMEAVRQCRLVGIRISICDDHQPCHSPEHSFCLRRDGSQLPTCFLRMSPHGTTSLAKFNKLYSEKRPAVLESVERRACSVRAPVSQRAMWYTTLRQSVGSC